MRFYDMIGRTMNVANNRYVPVVRNFAIQCKALKDRKDDHDDPDVPKITRSLQILKWSETMKDFCRVRTQRYRTLCFLWH
jgi:hypothetical protein